ncbi:hypothetical protein EIP86_006475 [Pleurotus ostreatoroseus]|nr:hypothetical protein EIP86_006475 [Pleurotus ostreatoroseus]
MSSRSTKAHADPTSSHAAHELVAYLNELDEKLGIPIALESPCELTPSLLLAILESLTRQRLPIPQAIRAARDREAKVQAMKIFLGVLENDVLGEDVGLSAVDPRRLAAGEWDEVVFVGEVLCWLGKVFGVIPHARLVHPRHRMYVDMNETSYEDGSEFVDATQLNKRAGSSDVDRQPLRQRYSPNANQEIEPSMSMSHADRTRTMDATVLSTEPDDTETPSLSELDLFDAPSRIGRYATSTPPPPPTSLSARTPRCIQEVADPSYVDHEDYDASEATHIHDNTYSELSPEPDMEDGDASTASYCDCAPGPDPESPLARYAQPQAVPVRRSGWLREVDLENELRAFEDMKVSAHARARDPTSAPPPAFTPRPTPGRSGSAIKTPVAVRPTGRVVTRHTSPTQYTLALLNERAKLLEELAILKADRSHTPSRTRRP